MTAVEQILRRMTAMDSDLRVESDRLRVVAGSGKVRIPCERGRPCCYQWSYRGTLTAAELR